MGDHLDKICEHCGMAFRTTSTQYHRNNRRGYRFFCTRWCRNTASVRARQSPCTNCGTAVPRRPCDLKKVKNVFCSRSCAGSYNNRHKSKGSRRSKLEAFIVQRLQADFPAVEVLANDIRTIGAEIDILIPSLKLGIELNGILHYEPIYGAEKLERIVANDQQKVAACREKGIELAVIDVSWMKYFKPAAGERVYDVVKSLVIRLLPRAA